MDKLTFGAIVEILLAAALIASWYFSKDGMVTTAILGIFGTVAGTLLGFSIGKNTAPPI